MALPVASYFDLKGMAGQLAVLLNTGGKKGRQACENLHGKLADVAIGIADPTMTIEALLRNLKEIGSLVLDSRFPEDLLGWMMKHVEEEVSAQRAADASQAIPLLKSLILLVAGQLNMTPLCDSVPVEMIGGRDYNFAKENVDAMVNSSAELSAPNAPYTVVSIVGAQSSGKSYLLNQLFGTKFPVMDATLGWSQTTKGIFMSRCIEPSMVVLDTEGFDGIERGQDTSFENQAVIFTLTVSDQIMVNISIHDIGREQGGGQQLFNKIFQERTKVPPGLTNIVVVIRGDDGEVPLTILRQDVMEMLEKTWKRVNGESTAFTDYIKVNVVALPEKNSPDFLNEVAKLRKLLTKFTRGAKVPAPSFSLSSEMLWNNVKQNKKVDLPSHMMLLAEVYCQQTVKACMGQLDDDLLRAKESTLGFKEVSNTLLASIITQYNRQTEMYNAVVRYNERQKMVDIINKELNRKIQEDTFERFNDEISRELENIEKTDEDVNYDDHKVKSYVEKLANLCGDLNIFDLEYLHNCGGDIQRKLTLYIGFHILSLKDRAREAVEEQERSRKKMEELTAKLDQMMEEKQRREGELQKEQEKHIREKVEFEHRQRSLGNELEIQKERTRKFDKERQEFAREAVEEQERSGKKMEELAAKLDHMREERLRREGDIQQELENNKRAKEEMERKQHTIEKELQIQKERTRKFEEKCLEERARDAIEEQKRYDKKIEELMTKLSQRMEERQHLEEKVQWEQENNKRTKEEMECKQQTLENKLEIQKERTRKLEEAQAQASTSINLPIHFWLKWLFAQVMAWFQVVMGLSDYEWLQAPMEDLPITASLGPIDRVIRRLQLLEGSKQTLPVGLSADQIKGLREHFQEFRKPLKNFADNSLRSKWMKEVRELCYDTEDYLEKVIMMQSGGGAHWRLGNLGRIASIFVHRILWRSQLSQFMDRAIGLVEIFPECLDEENEAVISLMKGYEADAYLHMEQKAGVEHLPIELVNQLAFDDDKQTKLKVVAISGSAGAGKTAVATTVYLKYKRKFQCRAIVHVSRSPDFQSLLTSIISQIKAPPPRVFPDMEALIACISEHLQDKRYFVVIDDDVWGTSVWDFIGRAFPVDNRGSRIIITTQSEHVALACSTIFKMDTTSEDRNEILNLAYNNLPLHLKTCLLYFRMYTEGYTITKNDLVKQWIAEGFTAAPKRQGKEEISEVPQSETEEISEAPRNKTEEIAGGYFDELVTRGMIQPVDRNHEGQVLSCTVHHMVLDLIKDKSKEDNFIVVVDNRESAIGHPDIVRRLSIQFGCEKGASIPESIMLSQVRSLTFCGFLKCVPSIGVYQLLRVLILNIWADEDKIFDLTRIGELYHLRYLKIECNITVRLPSKIRWMKHLGTLELHAQVVAIPSDIGQLEKLMHVLCPSNANILDLGELTNLLDLKLTWSTHQNREENMNCLRSILEKLGNLRCLSLTPASGSYNVNALQDEASVSRMSISCDSLCMVSLAPTHLQRLEFSRRCCIFSRLPKWLGELAQLRILKIAVEELLKEDTYILKAIPSLTVISLHVKKMSAKRVVFGKGGFLVLTYFKFTCTVPWLKFEADAMPNLEKLRLCFNATTVVEQGGTTPIIIEHLSSGLKEITAIICCARGVDASSTLLKAISNDPSNPDVQLMSSIYYGDECRGIHCRILLPPESSDLLFPGMERPYNELEKKLHDPNVAPMSFPLEFLKAITSDFSTESVLGQGGFGVVYKGVLTCGKIIAVKKLSEVCILEETFQKEVCYHMGIKHPNVVQCLGCCAESSWHPMEQPSGSGKYIVAETLKRLICFEYVCNRSLDEHIYGECLDLEWNMRYKIIKGICNGLHFIHEECHMVHLDLKPQNILMDSTMMPKIADFGLSRIFGEQKSRTVTENNNKGTFGYMAPEYLHKGVVSYKADIFSLGVIVIEIITGGRDYPMDYPYFQQDSPQSTDPSFQQFTEKVLGSWRNKFGSTPKHKAVEKYAQQVKKCVAIALKCVDPDMKKRPTVKYIIEVLNEAEQIGDSRFEMRETPDVAVEILKVKEEIDAKLEGEGITGV